LQEEQALGRLLRDPAHADAARALLVDKNRGLVNREANRHLIAVNAVVSRRDLEQLGWEGFLYALTKYDPERGLKLSTYAIYWIRQRIQRGLDTDRRGIRLPVHLEERTRKVIAAQTAFEMEHGRRPSDAEIGDILGLGAFEVSETRRAAFIQPASLDKPRFDNPDDTAHTIAPLMTDYAEDMAQADASERLRAIVGDLPEQLRRLVVLRYGMDAGGNPRTLEQVGEILGVGRERVRQIEELALGTLRELVDPEAFGREPLTQDEAGQLLPWAHVLPTSQRRIVELRCGGELTLSQIAADLGMSKSWVLKLEKRALRALRSVAAAQAEEAA
jgi:RNA polymerase sigma factor (sigma-70 family)